MKLVKTPQAWEAGPNCEHCGMLEIGSFVFEDGGTAWCLACANSIKPISDKRWNQLIQDEANSRIVAHRARIAELESPK